MDAQVTTRTKGRPLGSRNPSRYLDTTFSPEPPWWPDDGGAKRVPIYDHNGLTPRLVRKVGWVNCLGRISLRQPHRWLSPDVAKVRCCPRCASSNDSRTREADND